MITTNFVLTTYSTNEEKITELIWNFGVLIRIFKIQLLLIKRWEVIIFITKGLALTRVFYINYDL